jgi:CheY-like chemotaxis protein
MEKRILLADDSLTIQKVVELTFADSDYRVTAVSNGRVALERVREEPPDLILADVVMPEKNGYELCEEIKRNPATAHIPVVLLAGTFEPFDRARAEGLDCDAIVSKPFDSRELFRKVEALLAQPAGARARTSSRGTGSDALRGPDPAPVGQGAPVGRTTLEEIHAPRPFGSAPRNPFDSGFVDEDFTGSIKTFPSGRGEPLGSLYGPEDVHSALEAFREVEPTARVADRQRESPHPAGEPPPARTTRDPAVDFAEEATQMRPPAPAVAGEPTPSADDSRTQRIDVSDFRPPKIAPAAAEAAPLRRDTGEIAAPPAATVGATGARAETLPSAGEAAPDSGAPARELTDSEIDRLAERVAQKVIEKLSDRVVREVAWEVVPETAELVVRERLRELESGVE